MAVKLLNNASADEIYNDTEDHNENYDYESQIEMAEQLYWRPICDNSDPLDKQLKWILKEEDMTINPLTVKDIGFLKGLKAAGIKDAIKLIEAIQKYGYIELYEQ